MRIEDEQARLFYARDAAQRQLGVRDLRKQIARKPFERQEIANTQLTENSKIPFNVFKDSYLICCFFTEIYGVWSLSNSKQANSNRSTRDKWNCI
jgi:hypothetical protein